VLDCAELRTKIVAEAIGGTIGDVAIAQVAD
jgi:hypothetical protein